MTPEECHALADALVERADRIDDDIIERAIPTHDQASRAEEWSVTLRRAALALREVPSTELTSAVLSTAEVVMTRAEDGTLIPEVTREGNRVVPFALELFLQMVGDLNATRAEANRLREGIKRHREETLRPEHRVGGKRDHDLWALLDPEGDPDE